MNAKPGTGGTGGSWNLRLWVWVLLCSVAIFATVPVARGLQVFVYSSVGREFFMYLTLSFICAAAIAVLYFLAFKLEVRNISRYVWVLICSFSYAYITWHLRQYPEEAIHLVEYAVLSFFIFKALGHRIQDSTVYITTILMVAFIGTSEEFLQWIIPGRYWAFKDIGINILGGGIFQLAVWKGIRPNAIRKPPKKVSVKMLASVLTVDLILLALCLSNTPQAVSYYTDAFHGLSWLRNEEPMSEFGFLKSAWMSIIVSLTVVWILARRWMKRLH